MRTLLRDIARFVVAVFWNWVGVVTGGLMTLAVAAVLAWRDESALATGGMAVVGFVGLFSAVFLAWRAEHRKRLEIEALSRPRFEAEILAVNTHPLPNKPGSATLLVIQARNRGADSIAEKFRVTATGSESGAHTGELLLIPEELTLVGETGTVVYRGTDALYLKTNTPIPRGGKVVGVLWAHFNKLDLEALRTSVVTVSFVDVEGRSYSVSSQNTGRSDAPMYYPGLRIPRHRPPKRQRSR